MNNITLTIELTEEQVIDSIVSGIHGREEMSALILSIDAAFADADFTEALILKLAQSLRGDLTDEEHASMAAKIAAMKPTKVRK